jgi:hypothetical protein
MPASTASGGGAAAVKNATRRPSSRRSASEALISICITIGAPQRCVTPCSAISRYIASARTCRRQTCVPATIDSVQGKHQPLQWNIGRVQR